MAGVDQREPPDSEELGLRSEDSAPTPATRRRLIAATFAAVALLLLPLSYFFGGTVIRFVTNQGLLVVEVDDRNVEITVKQNGLVVQDKTTDREFQLKPVAGQVEVYDKGGNLRLLTKKFTLTRGGKAYVTVTLRELAQARHPAADATRLAGSRAP